MLRRPYRRSLVGAVGAAAAADSGAENARHHSNYLRSSGQGATLGVDVRQSGGLRSSADLGPLLKLRGTEGKSPERPSNALAESGTIGTGTLRRTWEADSTYDAQGRLVYGSLDDMPMLSSLSQPLTLASSHASSASRRRYGDDPTPSFVSSLGDETADSHQARGTSGVPAFPSMDRGSKDSRPDDKSFDSSWRDSLSQSRFSGTNTTLATTIALDHTVDSEGAAQIDHAAVQRAADAYERAAYQRSRLDSGSDEGEGEGVSIMESPFRDYGGHSADNDTHSVNSLALSDSHNTME